MAVLYPNLLLKHLTVVLPSSVPSARLAVFLPKPAGLTRAKGFVWQTWLLCAGNPAGKEQRHFGLTPLAIFSENLNP